MSCTQSQRYDVPSSINVIQCYLLLLTLTAVTIKHPFLIRAPRRNNYLVADTSGSYNGGFFGHFFYARQSRASKFMFGKVGAREKKGFVKHNIEVELACCNDAGEPIAVVQRFEGDQTTSGTEQIRNSGFIEFQ